MSVNFYPEIAKVIATRSKCVSLKVGCILVKDDKIISTGFNGTPKGFINCCDKFPKGRHKDHHDWSQKYEIHAEMNALLRCDTDTTNAVAYITHSPCANCAKHLIAAGVKTIHASERYPKATAEDIINLEVFCDKMGVIFIRDFEIKDKNFSIPFCIKVPTKNIPRGE